MQITDHADVSEKSAVTSEIKVQLSSPACSNSNEGEQYCGSGPCTSKLHCHFSLAKSSINYFCSC